MNAVILKTPEPCREYEEEGNISLICIYGPNNNTDIFVLKILITLSYIKLTHNLME